MGKESDAAVREAVAFEFIGDGGSFLRQDVGEP